MKKLITTFALFASVVAQAEYMLWSVSDSQWSGKGITDVASMRVGYVIDPGDKPDDYTVTAYDLGGDSMESADVSYSSGTEYIVKFDSSMTTGNYSFYIELLNSSGEVVGRTGDNSNYTYAQYTDLKKDGYVVTGDIGSVPTVNVWHGGSFEAVPEPSSMALLALGAGLVGLRRKLKKGKKEKRA